MNPLNDFQLRNFLDSVYRRRKNMIVNGDLMIDQLNGGAAVAFDAVQRYTCDNFKTFNATAAVGTTQRVASTIAGYGVDFEILASVTVPAAPAAADVAIQYTGIEGSTFTKLMWGTVYARPLCLGFWAKGSVVGEYGFQVHNVAAARSYQSTYTIFQANTPEFKIVSIPGDTTGTWLTGNTNALYLVWDLGSGVNLETGAVNQWKGTVSYRTASCVKLTNAGGAATLRIGGVRAFPDFVDQYPTEQTYGEALAECQRYHPKVDAIVYYTGQATGVNNAYCPILFPTQARAAPAGIVLSPAYGAIMHGAAAAAIPVTNTILAIGRVDGALLQLQVAAGLVAGDASMYEIQAGALFFTGAELV